MQNSIIREIRERLGEYIAGQVNLREFEDWFIPRSWNIEKAGSSDAEKLAGEIELRLAELSDGHWTEDEMKDLLRPLVHVQEYAPTTGTGSSGKSKISNFFAILTFAEKSTNFEPTPETNSSTRGQLLVFDHR